ncbi:uncharacterized protein PHALS_13643 [Plasmopara halstedii]|uniref:Uncharacterized protein n=1 Tax=Plasmopara halstedii TaxID=4781 RepID=A0A0P1ARA7_PLAHL|nr:uncharacterized protein PHALS_13643 [Plasmopara halstedii]CEG43448.1 hypothetical protein PHALS_13643 [Plasmopara halstedii]|eukprot:XP_024579817.1 hypothetical protein PHALS_13643 [Plasmopara halstedii]
MGVKHCVAQCHEMNTLRQDPPPQLPPDRVDMHKVWVTKQGPYFSKMYEVI